MAHALLIRSRSRRRCAKTTWDRRAVKILHCPPVLLRCRRVITAIFPNEKFVFGGSYSAEATTGQQMLQSPCGVPQNGKHRLFAAQTLHTFLLSVKRGLQPRHWFDALVFAISVADLRLPRRRIQLQRLTPISMRTRLMQIEE